MENIFNENNTEWENEFGNYYLVYTGDLEELACETGLSEDKLVEMLGEYEDDSRDMIETEAEIAMEKKGAY